MLNKLKHKVFYIILCLVMFRPLQGYSATQEYNSQKNLQLTHTLMSALLNSYFSEGDEKFRAQYLADKAYIQTFLNTWDEEIRTKKYKSSTEIFESLRNRRGYLSKYYFLWNALVHYNYKSDKLINLGYHKNTAFTQLLSSEKQLDMQKRILEILRITNIEILANSKDYALALIIASPFEKSENVEIRTLATQIIKQMPFQKGLQILNAIKNFIVIPGGFLKSVTLPEKLAVIYKSSQVTRLALKGKIAKHGSSALNRINPFLKHITPMQVSLGASAGLHGLLFLDYGSAEKKDSAKNKFDSIDAGLVSLWESTQLLNSKHMPSQKDFKPQYPLLSKKQLISIIQEHLKSLNPMDYSQAFLSAEKLIGTDGRNISDQQAYDFVSARMQTLKEKVRLRMTGKIDLNKINEIRELIINDSLRIYKRDYPTLTHTLLGWGGNCVAQTMMFISILSEHQSILWENGFSLGIANFTDHIEAVIHSTAGENKILYTVSGKVEDLSKEAVQPNIYRPELLMIMLLHSLGTNPDDIANRADAKLISSDKFTGFIDKSRNAYSKLSQSYYRSLDFTQRSGLFEYEFFDIDTAWQDSRKKYSKEDPPETAELKYIPIENKQKYADLNSVFNSSSNNGGDLSSDYSIQLSDIEIQFRPELDLGKSRFFEYDTDHHAREVIHAYTENQYYRLRKAKSSSFSLLDFQYKIMAMQMQYAENILKNPDINKYLFGDESKNIDKIMSYSNAEIQKILSYRRLINFIKNTDSQICMNYQHKSSICEDHTAIKSIMSSEHHIDVDHLGDEWVKIEGLDQIIFDFYDDPKSFVDNYIKGNILQRKLLYNIMEFSIYSDPASSLGPKEVLPKIKQYLDQLDPSKVAISHQSYQADCIPFKGDFQLPVSSDKSPFLHVENQPGVNCQKEKSKKEQKNQAGSKQITIPLNVLIELSYLTDGGGMQLWDKGAIDAFHQGAYAELLLEGPYFSRTIEGYLKVQKLKDSLKKNNLKL
ncbi:MAG: hypothetical protein V4596_12265 [Bdellovibrionota bacterium]